MTKEELIERLRKVHSDKYDYSKVEYADLHTKVCIICPEHGEFWQTPAHHLYRKQGCPKCNGMYKTTEEVIKEFKKVHGDKYDYSKLEYKGGETKVCIICPEHGEFWQIPTSHSKGQGCPECGGSKKLTTEEFIKKAKVIHGEKYNYDNVAYINAKTKVSIKCNTCGNSFAQTPNSHLRGNGCPFCRGHNISLSKTSNTIEFIEKAKKMHGDKYNYEYVEYKKAKEDVCIVCPKHGKFWQMPDKHLSGEGCPICGNLSSNYEIEIKNELEKILGAGNVENRNKTLIKPKEIDLYIRSKNIGIEINGVRWHSELFGRDRNYHLNKMELCQKNGISLINIFEDEYVLHKEIVISKLKNILHVNNSPKIYARKCYVKEITKEVSKDFLTKNHIQGYVNSSIHLGCFQNNEIIGVMSFKKLNKINNTWELTRFASDINYHCVGVGGKLFSYFIKTYKPLLIKSFADRRWTINEKDNLYTKLGFKLTEILKPDYRYYTNKTIERIHKFNMRKDKLLKKHPNLGLTEDMTEKEMCNKLGFYRIWDCGLLKYEWCSNVEK